MYNKHLPLLPPSPFISPTAHLLSSHQICPSSPLCLFITPHLSCIFTHLLSVTVRLQDLIHDQQAQCCGCSEKSRCYWTMCWYTNTLNVLPDWVNRECVRERRRSLLHVWVSFTAQTHKGFSKSIKPVIVGFKTVSVSAWMNTVRACFQ